MCISSALKKTAREKSYDRIAASNCGVFNESLFLRWGGKKGTKIIPTVVKLNIRQPWTHKKGWVCISHLSCLVHFGVESSFNRAFIVWTQSGWGLFLKRWSANPSKLITAICLGPSNTLALVFMYRGFLKMEITGNSYFRSPKRELKLQVMFQGLWIR